jgi:hypothetical protein
MIEPKLYKNVQWNFPCKVGIFCWAEIQDGLQTWDIVYSIGYDTIEKLINIFS